jgi:eukaryotic-like serine/threonine-protein kinase
VSTIVNSPSTRPGQPVSDTPSTRDDFNPSQTPVVANASTLHDFRIQPDQVNLPPVGAFLGRCKLQTLMASGTNSAVYRGELWDLGIDVAVKVLAPRHEQDRPILAQHLRNEFDILRRLQHSSIIRLWDYRPDPDQPHVATEYCDSITLDKLMINHGGRLTIRFAVRLVIKILDGLTAAWKLGVAHRDLQPKNILVLPDGSVKIIDWGLAGWIGEEDIRCTTEEMLRYVGGPTYLAPEMIGSNKSFDHRTDMYGLGATMYHLVTGQPPYPIYADDKRPTLGVMLGHKEREPVPPYELVHELGILRFSEVIHRMLSKDPEDRIANPEELKEDLYRILADDSSIRSKLKM